jgi:hypothetical protein
LTWGYDEINFEAMALDGMPADKSDLRALPERETWVNVHTLGVKGDGESDDTEAIRPSGRSAPHALLSDGTVRVTDTIVLKPDTVLVALHPNATQFVINDGTEAFQGVGAPKSVIEARKGGTNILSGIGIYTNAINPRARRSEMDGGQGLDGQRRPLPRRPRQRTGPTVLATIPTTTRTQPIPISIAGGTASSPICG